MKRISTLLTAAAVFFAVNANAQSYTETFEPGAVPTCTRFNNSYLYTESPIDGTTSLSTDPPVNNQGNREYISPNLEVTAANLTLNISYWYKLNEDLTSGGTQRSIEVLLLAPNAVNPTSINTLTLKYDKDIAVDERNPAQRSFNYTVSSPGLYKLVIRMSGGGGSGTTRTIIDNINVNADANFASCNLAPTATSDMYLGTTAQPYTSTVSVLANDSDPEGQLLTASLAVPSPDGTVTFLADGNFEFVPNDGFFGTSTTFQYQVCDNGYPSRCATTTVTINFVDNISLPIKLTSFAGSTNNNRAQLKWLVADNETGAQFQVQRSSDARTFTEAGTVAISNKIGTESYSFNDSRELDAVTYYKLKIVNKDGSVSYSNVIALKSATAKSTSGINILQNPVESTLTFTYSASTATQGQITIYNALGVKVYSQRINSQKGNNSLSMNLDSHLAAGTYILEVVNGSERAVTRMIKR